MKSEQIYKNIQGMCKCAAEEILSGSSLESFLKLDLKSQLLGLKVFAYTGHEFEVVKEIEGLEKTLNSLPVCD